MPRADVYCFAVRYFSVLAFRYFSVLRCRGHSEVQA